MTVRRKTGARIPETPMLTGAVGSGSGDEPADQRPVVAAERRLQQMRSWVMKSHDLISQRALLIGLRQPRTEDGVRRWPDEDDEPEAGVVSSTGGRLVRTIRCFEYRIDHWARGR